MLVQSVKKLEHGENCSKTRFSMSKDLLLTLINYINSKLNPGDTILLEMQEMLLIHHPIQDQSFPQRSISSLGVHVVDEVDDSVGVSILVVVPGDQLDKGS